MLASLAVRDIVLIERAELSFAPGLNVLTGETGAGKSILLDALVLAAGERGQGRAQLRPGTAQGSVTAVFEVGPGHPARALLAGNDISAGDMEAIILRRAIGADGRSRAFVNDQPVGIQFARELGAALVEVHGQHDDRGLFDTATHRISLDAFGGYAPLVAEVAKCFAGLSGAEAWLREAEAVRAAALAESEYVTHAADELRRLAPQPGEEAALAATRAFLTNGEKLAQDISAAADLVTGDGGVEIRLAGALRRLSRLAPEGRQATAPAEAALDAALVQVQEASRALDSLLAQLDPEPGKLEQIEDRLYALRAAARKYQVPSDALAACAAQFEAKCAQLTGGDAAVKDAKAEVARLRAALAERGAALSAARKVAAGTLEKTVLRELAPLKLGLARFRVALTPLSAEQGTAHGFETVGFEIATVEGAAFGPLARIASGGELARIALALKVALAEANPPAILVFDEVDRGVGGAVAAAVGDRLQRLAETTQVLLVTHSPQVAARGARHFRIARDGGATHVALLSADERVEEIARMLAGAAVSEEARAAARRLLAEAQAKPAPRKRIRA
jgi:DNA repair protein RecN (Recombination protein N)